jgi:hypothetical protein
VGSEEKTAGTGYEVVDGVKTPLPIAVSGELKIMPPSTGLPVAAANGGPRNSALKGLLDAVPAAETAGADEALGADTHASEQELSLGTPETAAHGD